MRQRVGAHKRKDDDDDAPLLPTTIRGGQSSSHDKHLHRDKLRNRCASRMLRGFQRMSLMVVWRKQSPKKRLFLLTALLIVLVVILQCWKPWRRRNKDHYQPVPAELLFGNASAVAALYEQRYGAAAAASMEQNPTPNAWPTIFYNIFLPKNDPEGYQRAVSIVEEQLQQIVASLGLDDHDAIVGGERQNVQVYANTIGRPLSHPSLPRLCTKIHPKLQCTLLRHYENATETVTLQALYDHCTSIPIDDHHDAEDPPHQEERVVYLHSKGSFHDNHVNTAWRRALTAAALHPTCWNPPVAACNLCGLQFYTQFTMFIPGNMWTADCAYVRQLLPPARKVYAQKRQEAVKQVLLYRLTGHLKSQLLRDRRDYFGLDRYAVEHWIGSHPALLPCDVVAAADLMEQSLPALLSRRQHNTGFAAANDSLLPFRWSLAPRHPGFAVANVLRGHERLHAHPDTERRREYYLLPGHLLKWHVLYNGTVVPTDDSWVWTWFPDGDLWRDAVREYGSALTAVERVTLRLAQNDQAAAMGYPTIHSSSRNNDGSKATTLPPDLTTPSFRPNRNDMDDHPSWFSPHPSGRVIFYHIVLPMTYDTDNDTTAAAAQQTIQMQLGIIGHQPATLFFNVVSDQPVATDRIMDLCAVHSTLECRPMHQLDRNFNGETLQQLFEFCAATITESVVDGLPMRVAYISNQGPTQLLRREPNLVERKLVRHLTKAVTSEPCLKPSAAQASCNACGLSFYTTWTLFFPGNMFAASCSYVNKLIPPIDFEDRLRDAIGDVLLARLRQQIVSNLVPDRIDYWGLKRYATEHWIASHPDLVPCDVAPLKYRRKQAIRDNDIDDDLDLTLSMAPRPSEEVPVGVVLNSTAKTLVLSNSGLRRREYQFLAGHLLKWYHLYGKAPPADSWVWNWFPEGALWRDGVAEHGDRVVEALTFEFVNDGV